VHYGILYQQKALLQIYNRTAYDLIKNLSKELYQAKLLTKFTIQSIWNLYKYLKYFNPIKSIHNTMNHNHHHHHHCYTKVYQLFTSIVKDILSKNTLSIMDPDQDQHQDQDHDDDDHYHHEENQYFIYNHTLDHIELQLINSFFETKVIVSPSSSLLRKILTVVMKFRYLLSNSSNLSSTYISNKNRSSMLNINSLMDNTTQFRSQFHIMNCSHLIPYYNEQMNKCGETASGALTRLDYVNLQLHNLIKNNHFIRLIHPKHSYPYTELSISRYAVLALPIRAFTSVSDALCSSMMVSRYVKFLTSSKSSPSNLLLTIFISIFTLYLTLFIIIEYCSFKQTTKLTNQICSKCQSTNQNVYHPHPHRHDDEDDSCNLLSIQQYNQLTSFETLPPNNNNSSDGYYPRCTQRYHDSNRKNFTYSKYGKHDLDEAFSNNNNGLNSFIPHKLEHHYTYDHPISLLHTSNVMYKCDNLCRTKAYLHDENIDDNEDDVHSLSLPRIETFNDENINKTILITPKLINTPYSCCTTSTSSSSKYNLHSSYCK
ncbi:unnamed protein product, partial [Schistosoma curassoni]|uniref:Protein kinase domain-containing protein n=1 Tax=Schistosoma curassoni TaxID=6186 RepID=A0A183JC52_9TREM